eukprot:1724223-Prymnesium_polylepis.1
MATPPQAESTQRNRISVCRRSRARSCKSDAGKLVASTLAGKICQSRAAPAAGKLQSRNGSSDSRRGTTPTLTLAV